jgi:hypothetical protein
MDAQIFGTTAPPIWLLNRGNEMTPVGIGLTALTIVLGIACVVVVIATRRIQSRYALALKTWEEFARKEGFRFNELGVQKMTILGTSDEDIEFKVTSEESMTDRGYLVSDLRAIITRVSVSLSRETPCLDLNLVTCDDHRDKLEKNDAENLKLEEIYIAADDGSLEPSQVKNSKLRQELIELAAHSDNVALSYGELVVTRNRLVSESLELTAMLEKALQTARSLRV